VFSDELQDVIDSLLAQACHDWAPPPRVDPRAGDAGQRRYERLKMTRLRLGQALAQRPDPAARVPAAILTATLLDESATDAGGTRGNRPCSGRPMRKVPGPLRSSGATWHVICRHVLPASTRSRTCGPGFWQACLTALIECDDVGVRRLLQTAFPNEPRHYPPELAGMLEQARRIAAADPERFKRMRGRSTGLGYRI
jgi:hypothetical protein